MGVLDVPGYSRTQADGKYAPRPRGNQTIVFGDSIDAAAQGWYHYYSLGSKSIQTLRNAGIAGNTTTMMLARFDTDVLAYNPDVVILGSATNDFGVTTISEATTRSNITTMVDTLRARGIGVVLRTTTPTDAIGTGVTVAERRQKILRYNAWMRGFGSARGIDVLDVYQAVADPTTGGYQAGIAADGQHPDQPGAKAIADYLLAQPIPLVWRSPSFAFARAVTDDNNMLVNGVFIGDSNADGLANSWLKSSGTATATLTAAPTGITGNWQRFTAADGTNAVYYQDVLTGYSTGNVLELVGRVRKPAGSTALVRLAPWGSAQPAIDCVASITQAMDGVFSARITVPGDATKFRVQIQTGTAAGYIEVAEVALRNLTTLNA